MKTLPNFGGILYTICRYRPHFLPSNAVYWVLLLDGCPSGRVQITTINSTAIPGPDHCQSICRPQEPTRGPDQYSQCGKRNLRRVLKRRINMVHLSCPSIRSAHIRHASNLKRILIISQLLVACNEISISNCNDGVRLAGFQRAIWPNLSVNLRRTDDRWRRADPRANWICGQFRIVYRGCGSAGHPSITLIGLPVHSHPFRRLTSPRPRPSLRSHV